MTQAIIILALILSASILIYTWLAIKAEKARLYYEEQGDNATKVLEEISKLFVPPKNTYNKTVKCDNCHENTAMATVGDELLCRVCYKKRLEKG